MGEPMLDRAVEINVPTLVHVVQAGRRKLLLPPAAAAVAAHYLVTLFNGGYKTRSPRTVAVTCLFLASKVVEKPSRLRDVVNVLHALVNGEDQPWMLGSPGSSRAYSREKVSIVAHESAILRFIGFDTTIDLPYSYIMNFVRWLQLTNRVAQVAVALVNDSLGAVIHHPPHQVAVASVSCATCESGMDFPLVAMPVTPFALSTHHLAVVELAFCLHSTAPLSTTLRRSTLLLGW
jgi:cyclin L